MVYFSRLGSLACWLLKEARESSAGAAIMPLGARAIDAGKDKMRAGATLRVLRDLQGGCNEVEAVLKRFATALAYRTSLCATSLA